jgi:UDP-N-acetylmuramoyl-tripeptide--D-alanyl-D-alanine ligase
MMLLSELAKVVGGELFGADVRFNSVGTDSRKIEAGQLFVALKGEKFDGNQYAIQALNDGAAAVLVSDKQLSAIPRVVVADTRLALGQLAAYWRQKLPAKLVAVTGSNGKTTTKEMLTAILVAATGDSERVHSTYGNLNNDVGLPLTLLKAKEKHGYIVAEMGMNHLGEIDYLTHIAKPDVAVINNAGIAHIGELGSRENIAKAKGEIFAGLGAHGIAVINADDAFFDYWKTLNVGRKVIGFSLQNASDVTASYDEFEGHLAVKLQTPKGAFDVNLNVMGQHNVYNALAASAAAIALDIPHQKIAQGLSEFAGVYGRLQRKTGFNGATLIDDTYNANPDSMKAAIGVINQLKTPNVFIMGDMGELGADAIDMHKEIGRYAKEHGVQLLLAYGELSQYAVQAFGAGAKHYQEMDALIEDAKKQMKKELVVLVKGSRFMRMERFVEALEEHKTIKMEGKPCF